MGVIVLTLHYHPSPLQRGAWCHIRDDYTLGRLKRDLGVGDGVGVGVGVCVGVGVGVCVGVGVGEGVCT